MPRHFLILRHGQTESNAKAIMQGHLPVALNDVGRRQADLLAQRLATWQPKVDVLVSSDLARAMQTAEPIAKTLGLPIVQDAAWREKGLGPWEGKLRSEVEAWRLQTGDWDPPGSEPLAAFQRRTCEALAALPDRFPTARCVAVVTHGGCVRTILRALRRGDLSADGPVPAWDDAADIHNCSILHLRIPDEGPARFAVACANDYGHLGPLDTATDAG